MILLKLICIISGLFIFVYTFSYGIYEFKINKFAGCFVISLDLFLILVMIFALLMN